MIEMHRFEKVTSCIAPLRKIANPVKNKKIVIQLKFTIPKLAS